MNNDFNNYNKDSENEAEKRTEEEVSNAPVGDAKAEPTADMSAEAPAPEEPKTENTGANSGEYRYTGSGLGDHRREDTTDSRGQSGSYTYHSSNSSYGGGQDAPENGTQRQNYGGWNQPPHNPYGGMPPYTPPTPPTPKKEKRGASKAALAVTVIVSILLSAAAGFGGAYLYNDMYGIKDNVSSVGGADGQSVIHRVVETDETTSTGEKGIYTDVAATVKDSVVEITTEFQVTGFFQYVSEGAGSGVIISEDGYIITNNHVISDSDSSGVADTITVRLTNGNEYKAELVGKDADSDIAVIKITPDETLTFAVFGDSDKLTVGEEVIAVGNPLGELGGTVTNGIISALDREINVDGTNMNLLQTNAAINPGNSGGGLFNMKGELIGVVNAKSSGSGIEGLGFAIPANDAFEVAEQLMENGYVTGKVYLGVTFYDVTDAYTAYRYFKSQATGVYVADLVEGYNDQALKYGDRIVAIDGNEITEFSQIKDLLKDHAVGDTLKFTIYRAGKLTEVQVTCFEYVPEDVSIDFGEES